MTTALGKDIQEKYSRVHQIQRSVAKKNMKAKSTNDHYQEEWKKKHKKLVDESEKRRGKRKGRIKKDLEFGKHLI